eukprot:4998768-Pyramimonas_sp.AAC.1
MGPSTIAPPPPSWAGAMGHERGRANGACCLHAPSVLPPRFLALTQCRRSSSFLPPISFSPSRSLLPPRP